MAQRGRPRKAVKGEIALDLGVPNEKQAQFLTSTARYTAYGGARGGGKSWAVRVKGAAGALYYPGIKILMLRRTYPELENTIIQPLVALLNTASVGGRPAGDKLFTYNVTLRSLFFANGSIIKFGHLQSANAITEYQGQEYDWIFLDEATHFTEWEFRTLAATLRGVNRIPKRMYLTCNPGGVGHLWVKRLFVAREYLAGEDPGDYVFISATVEDNKALMEHSPDYLRMLDLLPDDIRAAHRYGDWDAMAGQFFAEFKRETHVVKPFVVPREWVRYRAIDYGLDMFACLWVAVDFGGRAWVYREVQQLGLVVGGVNAVLEGMQADKLIKGLKVMKRAGLDTAAKRVADYAVDAGLSLGNEVLQEVAQEGATMVGVEAAQQYQTGEHAYSFDEVLNRLGETAGSSLLTFGTLGIPGAVRNITHIATEGRTNAQIGAQVRERDAVQNVIDEGMQSGRDTDSYKRATSLQEKLDQGKTVTDEEVGILYKSNVEAVREEQQTREIRYDTESILMRLAEEGVGEQDAARQAEAIRTVLDGGEISGNKAATIATSEQAVGLLSELTGEAIDTDVPLSTLKHTIQALASRAVAPAEETSAGHRAEQSAAQSNAPTLGRPITEQAHDMSRIARAASTLGKNGAKALNAAYDGKSDLATFYPGFAQYYEAGIAGRDMGMVSNDYALTEAQRLAAYSAGQNDAAAARQAAYFGENGGVVRDSVYKRANLSSKTTRVLDAVAKVAGVQVRFAERVDDGRANGKYENGTITIALDSVDPVRTVFTHEIVHRIKEVSPESYAGLARFVQENMRGERLRAVEMALENRYGTTDSALITEEVVADAFGRLMGDSKALERLTRDDRTVAQKVLDIVHDMVAAVKRALGDKAAGLNRDQRGAFQDLEGKLGEMSRVLEDALKRTEGAVSELRQKNTAQEGGGERYSLNVDFGAQFDAWLNGRTAEERKNSHFRFMVGTTSDALKSIGVSDYQIYWGASKIAAIMEKHGGMTADVIKSVPDVLEHPVVVMQSQTVANRITLFGETMDADGEPVMVAVELVPQNHTGEILDFGVIASAYGKNKNGAQGLLDHSDILYVDPDKKRTNQWLLVLGLQLPSSVTTYGSINSISTFKRNVNGHISFGETGGKTAMQEAFEKAQKEKETAQEGGGARYSLKDDQTGIKEQLRGNQDTLNAMEPVADIVVPFKRGMKMGAARVWAVEQLKKTGFQVDRQGFGRIRFDEKRLNTGLNYTQTDGEVAAYAAIPYILKRGIEIGGHDNHKGRQYSTVTFAGPVIINGTRGNMAVVVKKTSDNFYKTHRIVAPDGTVFMLSDAQNTEPTPTRGLTQEGTHAKSISSVSANSISTDGGKSNTQLSLKWTHELPDAYIAEYGELPRGEKAFREVTLPKKTGRDAKVSRTVRTVLEAEATPDVLVPTIEDLVADGAFSYEVYSDKQAIRDATAKIRDKGYSAALMDWSKAVREGTVSKANTAEGWALYDAAANSGDVKTAIAVLTDIVGHQRNAAQAVQATRILKQMGPDAELYGAQRSVGNLQEELTQRYGDRAPTLEINEELAGRLLAGETDQERQEAMKELYRDIGRQMPSRFRDKWNAWRYLAMLTNPRTHIRNVVGNAGFAPVVAVKNAVATGLEAVVDKVSGGKLERTKGVVGLGSRDRALLSAAWRDFAHVQEQVLGGGKYSDMRSANQYVEEGRVIFKTKPLEALRKGNSAFLDAEDLWFSRPHYAIALAQYGKANGITAEMLRSGKDVKLDKARAYAILEAQKATYRDTNALSEAISQMGRYRGSNKIAKAGSMLMEGILPFRKTPANILVRGVEDSPLGLLNGIKKAVADVGEGKSTAAEAIDSISAGLTGTGLLALGFFLAAQGLVRGAGAGNDEEKEFARLQGHQDYALELPDGTSITLDWLAPEALPFFVGVNLREQSGKDLAGMNMSAMLGAITSITEPLLEMSCLQSLDDSFDAVGYASDREVSPLVGAVASGVTSYLTQAVPTLLGQFERTSEEERMTTYADKSAWLTADMQYALGRVSARVPGMDFGQIPYIDAWGRTESDGGLGKRVANNFINPAYTSKAEGSAMEEELLRLYEQTGSGGVLPDRAGKSFPVNGENKYLTGEEYVSYATKRGQEAYRILTSLTANTAYGGMSDEEKVQAVGMAYEYANAAAKTSVSAYEPKGWVAKAISTTAKERISVSAYICAYMAQKDLVALKDRDGDTISNSLGLLIMQKVNGISGLSERQRKALYADFGVGKTVSGYNRALVEEKLKEMRKK